MIQLESVGLSIRGADGISPSLRDGEDKMSQLNSEAVCVCGAGGGEVHSFVLHLCSIQDSIDWLMPIHKGEGNDLNQMVISSGNTPHRHAQE